MFQNHPQSLSGASRQSVQSDFANAIKGQEPMVREIDQEFNRQADLMDDMEKALAMLRQRLQPVLCDNSAKQALGATAVPAAPPRQSPIGSTMHSRNERLNYFVGQLHIICQELAL